MLRYAIYRNRGICNNNNRTKSNRSVVNNKQQQKTYDQTILKTYPINQAHQQQQQQKISNIIFIYTTSI
jgi:hypothetical protein